MSILVIVFVWLTAAFWCFIFWLLELRRYTFKCLKESESDSPTLLEICSSTLILFINMSMFILQTINLIVARRRLKPLNNHLVANRSRDLKSYLKDALTETERNRIDEERADEKMEFRKIILNLLYNCINDNGANVFFKNRTANTRGQTGKKYEIVTLQDTFLWCNKMTSFHELFVAFEQYSTLCNNNLTVFGLESFCEKLKENISNFQNEDRERMMQLTSFVDQLVFDVTSFDLKGDTETQHAKRVGSATILFITLILVITCNIPAAYGVLFYFLNNYSIPRLFFSTLKMSGYARFIFTSIYILVVFQTKSTLV